MTFDNTLGMLLIGERVVHIASQTTLTISQGKSSLRCVFRVEQRYSNRFLIPFDRLFGTTSAQVYLYYRRPKDDNSVMKCVVRCLNLDTRHLKSDEVVYVVQISVLW